METVDLFKLSLHRVVKAASSHAVDDDCLGRIAETVCLTLEQLQGLLEVVSVLVSIDADLHPAVDCLDPTRVEVAYREHGFVATVEVSKASAIAAIAKYYSGRRGC